MCRLSSRVVECANKKNLLNLLCQTAYSLLDSCLLLFIGLDGWSLKNQDIQDNTFNNLFIYQTASVACGSTIHRHNSSPSVVVLVTLACLSWSHKCSVGLSPGLRAGHSIFTPKFWRYSPINSSLWDVILEDRVQSQTVEIQDCHWLQISSQFSLDWDFL